MTIKPEVKIPLLVDFHTKLQETGWNFSGSTLLHVWTLLTLNLGGPNEKDRQLLVEFDKVIAEYQLLNEGYV